LKSGAMTVTPSRRTVPRSKRTFSQSLGFHPLRTVERNHSNSLCPLTQTQGKPNGFWLDSFDCQRAGTPRPAGRTTGKRQYYRRERYSSNYFFRNLRRKIAAALRHKIDSTLSESN
jgi:hypothetical protein